MMPIEDNPILPFLEHQGVVVLDGGLATTLEARGCDLNDELWSARVLLEDPDTVRQVHLEFLEAGADCIATASYQASFPGLLRRGLSEDQAAEILLSSVDLACDARDQFWESVSPEANRLRPLVGASVGPYGAFLANGAEYTGDYELDEDELFAFHERRWHIFAGSPADLIECETIPSEAEGRALLRLLEETPDTWAWLSFSCRDGKHISDGTPIAELVTACDAVPNVAAIGVNCTAPEFIPSLIQEVRSRTDKPAIVYPNSGERYDAERKRWGAKASDEDMVTAAASWVEAGASLVGGCCRVGPSVIRGMRRTVVAADL